MILHFDYIYDPLSIKINVDESFLFPEKIHCEYFQHMCCAMRMRRGHISWVMSF